MSGVTFPPFANATSTGVVQIGRVGSNYQLPFSIGGLFGLATTPGLSLFGGNVSRVGALVGQMVPLLNGRRRLVSVFP